MSLEVLQDDKHALLLEVNTVAKIIHVGYKVRSAFDLWMSFEETTLHDYISTISRVDDMLKVIFSDKPICGPKTYDHHIVETGFQRLLQAWTTGMGLACEDILPLTSLLPLVIFLLKENVANSGETPLILITRFCGLDSLPSNNNGDAFQVKYDFWEMDRHCTIKREHWKQGCDPPFQVTNVPEAAQVGDIIARVSHSDCYSSYGGTLLALRPVKLLGKSARNLPPTYQIVGTFLRIFMFPARFPNDTLLQRIALV